MRNGVVHVHQIEVLPYRDLMLSTDGDGQARGFLASEEAFAFVKRFEIDNLLVPVIGNFAGVQESRNVIEAAGKIAV